MLGPEDFEECEKSGLARYECAHCQGHKLGDEQDVVHYGHLDPDKPLDESYYDEDLLYEVIGRSFQAVYSGVCTIDHDHEIRRGDKVARVRHADNPLIAVGGVACKNCIREIPKAKS